MNDVVIPYFTAILLAIGVTTSVLGESDQEFAPECTSWKTIKKQLEDPDSINCSLIGECTGLNCSGQYNGHNFKAEVIVEACEIPPRLNTTLDLPFLGAHNLKHTLKDGDKYEFPQMIGTFHIYVEVSMKKKNQIIYLSLTLKRELTITHSWLPDFPLLTNATISVPPCHNKSQLISTKPHSSTAHPQDEHTQNVKSTTTVPVVLEKKCNKSNVNDCGEKEICVENDHNKSECQCMDGFARNTNLECMPVLSFVGKKCSLTDLENACEKEEICIQESPHNLTGSCLCRKEYHDGGSGQCLPGPPAALSKNTLIIVLACVIPISLLLLCVIVVLAVKFRLVPRLRGRFSNVRTYEVVSIGNDDDEPLVA